MTDFEPLRGFGFTCPEQEKTTNARLVIFSWQGYMDEDRTFYSVSENAISGGKNV